MMRGGDGVSNQCKSDDYYWNTCDYEWVETLPMNTGSAIKHQCRNCGWFILKCYNETYTGEPIGDLGVVYHAEEWHDDEVTA